jgi:hypothetical protein
LALRFPSRLYNHEMTESRAFPAIPSTLSTKLRRAEGLAKSCRCQIEFGGSESWDWSGLELCVSLCMASTGGPVGIQLSTNTLVTLKLSSTACRLASLSPAHADFDLFFRDCHRRTWGHRFPHTWKSPNCKLGHTCNTGRAFVGPRLG